MKGVVLFQIWSRLSGWNGRKDWAGPGNTLATYIYLQTSKRNTIYFGAVSISCPTSRVTNSLIDLCIVVCKLYSLCYYFTRFDATVGAVKSNDRFDC